MDLARVDHHGMLGISLFFKQVATDPENPLDVVLGLGRRVGQPAFHLVFGQIRYFRMDQTMPG